jgi:hypothetical protein
MSPGAGSGPRQVRVYVPCTVSQLRDIVTSGGVGAVPFTAHAVTERLRAEDPGADDEELEYLATTAAAQASLGLMAEGEKRRVVVAVDVPSVVPVETDDPSTVQVDDPVPFRQLAAVLVDDASAAGDVAAAAEAWADAAEGSSQAAEAVERCLDHELGWYAPDEIGDLLDAETTA